MRLEPFVGASLRAISCRIYYYILYRYTYNPILQGYTYNPISQWVVPFTSPSSFGPDPSPLAGLVLTLPSSFGPDLHLDRGAFLLPFPYASCSP
uniref:Uncharacterized protein n=1 Tax=Picea sitchensis TaxID=3332 RepID=A0A6B9XUP0_PICSI|nr:hypothetical protein Q903MT_gene6653 [Picea sitchensis]